MSDLPPLRAPHEAGLARGVRREVVVVDVALLVDGINPVDHLIHAGCAQSGDVQHLGFAPLEQPGTMGGLHNPNFRAEWPEIGRSPTVDPDAFVHNAIANDALGE